MIIKIIKYIEHYQPGKTYYGENDGRAKRLIEMGFAVEVADDRVKPVSEKSDIDKSDKPVIDKESKRKPTFKKIEK